MSCSCNYPSEYLLPCRHVLKANVYWTLSETDGTIAGINFELIKSVIDGDFVINLPNDLLFDLAQSPIIPASISGPGLFLLPTRRSEPPKIAFGSCYHLLLSTLLTISDMWIRSRQHSTHSLIYARSTKKIPNHNSNLQQTQ